MLFSDCIPDKLQEHLNVSAFTSVLDSLQNFKSEVLARSLRVDNAGLLMNRKWLIKKLEEFGIYNIPLEYPLPIIQQYLLNVDTVCRTRGSKIGVELYCSLLSFGEVIIDDSDFYQEPQLLLLDSKTQGFITSDNTSNVYYLCEDSSIINQTSKLQVTIKSKYFNGDYPSEATTIKTYIENTLDKQLSFSPIKEVTYSYQTRDNFYFHELLNQYFV